MFLEHDGARTLGEIFDRTELAGLNFFAPGRAVDRDVDDLVSVKPVFDMTVIHDDPAAIEFIEWLQRFLFGFRSEQVI